jgi:hypothetical protein
VIRAPLPPMAPSPGLAVPAPQGGTREFYDRFVKDRFILKDGTMQRLPAQSTVRTNALSGRVVQILDASNVVVAVSETLPSGASAEVSCIVLLDTTEGLSAGQPFLRGVAPDKMHRCVTEGGTTNMVRGYRLPPEPPRSISFEEYLEVFKADSSRPGPEPIKSHEQLGEATPVMPSLSVGDAASLRSSYEERLRKRREILEERRRQSELQSQAGPEALKAQLQEHQMELIRAKGKLGPPLPMTLTKEMDDQLVSEGVLPPQAP